MQSLIDQLEQLDLPHLRAGDLRWMYSTGKGQITGSGRDKRHTYRTGIQTPMVVNPQHYRRLTLKQTMDAENVLLEQGKVIDFPLKPSDLSRYDEVLYD